MPPGLSTVAWYIIDKAGNHYYKVDASLEKADYGWKLTPGSIEYNSGNRGSSSKKTFEFVSKKDDVTFDAETWFGNWGSRISIILTNPSNDDVVSKSVTDGQWVVYNPGKLGTYTVRFVQNKEQTWTPYILYGYGSKHSDAIKQASLIASDGLDQEELDSQKSQFESIKGYGDVILPSVQQTQQQSSMLKDSSTSVEDTNLTMKNIDELYTDPISKVHVYAMRGYKPGETAYFSDRINQIYYDSINNTSMVTFESDPDNGFKFSGNLNKNYKSGEILNLKFKIVKLVQDRDDLYMLDYMKYLLDNSGKAPVIVSYLR